LRCIGIIFTFYSAFLSKKEPIDLSTCERFNPALLASHAQKDGFGCEI